jgi:hypothetical protein
MAKKRWYFLNDGNFGYSIEYAEEANESSMGQMGGWSDYDTFREAKKAMIERAKDDLADAKHRLKQARAYKKSDCE